MTAAIKSFGDSIGGATNETADPNESVRNDAAAAFVKSDEIQALHADSAGRGKFSTKSYAGVGKKTVYPLDDYADGRRLPRRRGTTQAPRIRARRPPDG
jgi:hypothetical protein